MTVFHCFSPFLCPIANCSHCSLLPSLFVLFKERRERFPCVYLDKRETVSEPMRDSFRLLLNVKKSESFIFSEQIALLLFRSQKTSDSLEKPTSKFPTLLSTNIIYCNVIYVEVLYVQFGNIKIYFFKSKLSMKNV